MISDNTSRLAILLLEDDEDDYFLIQDLLSDIEGLDFELSWVKDYEAALNTIAQKQYDVYLFDYRLGQYSATELMKTLVDRGCRVPIIILTGQKEREKDLEAMQAGAADYLIKGEITSAMLERSIRYAINREKAQDALRKSEERYALAAQGSNDGLWDWDIKKNTIYLSDRWCAMLGWSTQQKAYPIQLWLKQIHSEDVERFKVYLTQHLQGLTPYFEIEYRILHQNGHYFWVLCRGLAIYSSNGKAYRIAGSQTDLSNHRVLYDQLTGLSNRTLFLEQLSRSMKQNQQQPNYQFAVMFLDCDRFKLVNDSLGHISGDQLLIEVAKRISSCLRPGDVVARLGGDEFGILIENLHHNEDTTKIADRLNHSISQAFILNGHTIYISASIGIAFNTPNAQQPEDLLRNADTAMYRAKALGKNRYEIFTTTLYTKVKTRLQLEVSLRQAIEREEFRLHYQPILSLKTGDLMGVEALIRWQHPQQGLISPNDFILMAEETGLIIPIGEWVLYQACHQMQKWRNLFPEFVPLVVSVNLSRKQLSQSDLITQVSQILKHTELSASNLKLEVTETALMNQDEKTAIALMSELRELGVQLSLDDFGTGYSALSCLQAFPIDTLKLDRSFVTNLNFRGKNLAIIQAIVTLAHTLNMEVIAEGVETLQQLNQLKRLDCDQAQGYFLAKPLEPEAVPGWLFQKMNLASGYLNPLPFNLLA